MINSNGFTLIELLITISVISVGIAGVLIATQQSISVIDYANSRFTAALLAQEGVEIIKNIRDTNFLKGNSWNDGLSDGDHEVQYIVPRIAIYTDSYLTKDEHDFYNYTSADDTKFKRKVQITNVPSDKIELEITVYWRKRGGGYHELVLKEYIYNWYYF